MQFHLLTRTIHIKQYFYKHDNGTYLNTKNESSDNDIRDIWWMSHNKSCVDTICNLWANSIQILWKAESLLDLVCFLFKFESFFLHVTALHSHLVLFLLFLIVFSACISLICVTTSASMQLSIFHRSLLYLMCLCSTFFFQFSVKSICQEPLFNAYDETLMK